MIRVLYLTADKFPPFRVDIRVLFGDELAKRGIQTDWLLQSESTCDASYETILDGSRAWVGSTCAGSDAFARVRKQILGIVHDLRVFKLLREGDYDFVLVRNKVIAAVAVLYACRTTRTRPIYWMSFPFAEASVYEVKSGTARYPLFSLMRGFVFSTLLYRFILPQMHHVFVQSAQMKRDVMARGIDSKLLTPVPMGVQLRHIPAKDEFDLVRDGVVRLVYLGTLNRIRQIDFIIRVLALVRLEFPTAILELVGRGDHSRDIEVLEEEARRLSLEEAVFFVGFLPMSEAWAYVRRADVCISTMYPTPILKSTSPTKLIEYMAMGKPVVANDHPEQSQVIADSGCGICVGWSEHEFSDAITRILKDPAGAAEMGRKGRRYVQEHRAYSVIADQVAAKLAELRLKRQ